MTTPETEEQPAADEADSGKREPARVTIGVPVYNGEDYLAETLDSLLDQTYDHLEILVADNASTDGTRQIIAEYEQRDARVTSILNETNIGAAPNYNLVLGRATTEYFGWLSADDVLEPTYIKRAVELLDEHDDAVCVYSNASRIDESGTVVGDYVEAMAGMDLANDDPAVRFRHAVLGFPAIVLFGIMRREQMLEGPGHGAYIGGDRVFVSEMALRGKLLRVDEKLFRRRVHAAAYSAILDKGQKAKWFAGEDAQAGQPDIERIKQHLAALRRVPTSRRTKASGAVTLLLRFPLVLAKTNLAGVYFKVMRRFGRDADLKKYAG